MRSSVLIVALYRDILSYICLIYQLPAPVLVGIVCDHDAVNCDLTDPLPTQNMLHQLDAVPLPGTSVGVEVQARHLTAEACERQARNTIQSPVSGRPYFAADKYSTSSSTVLMLHVCLRVRCNTTQLSRFYLAERVRDLRATQ